MTPIEALHQIDELQNRYIYSLDNKDMAGWLDTFANPGAYTCIAAENEANDLPLALMLDDCYERLQDRVTFVNEVWAGTFEDYQARHFVQRLRCAAEADGSYRVESNFSVLYTPEQGQTEILVSGRYLDRVVIDGEARFAEKRAVMDTNVAPRYIVYPV